MAIVVFWVGTPKALVTTVRTRPRSKATDTDTDRKGLFTCQRLFKVGRAATLALRGSR